MVGVGNLCKTHSETFNLWHTCITWITPDTPDGMSAGKPREAIDMYLHNQEWPAAMRVAERCEPGAVDDIYLAQVCGPSQLQSALFCGSVRGVWGTRCSQQNRSCQVCASCPSSSRSQFTCHADTFCKVCVHGKSE